MSDKYTFLTQAPVHRVIGAMAIPTIISMLLTSMYNLVDTFFVGKINTQSTAAVGVVFSVMFFIQAFSFFFGNGSGNYISRQLGAQNTKDAEVMASTGLFYTLVFSLIVMLLGWFFLEPISILLGSTPTILPYTRQYLGISLLGTPFIMGTFCINNQMRFQGFTKYSVYGAISGSIINCLLDPVFIFVFSMGVSGAAVASVIGQICGFVIMLIMSQKEGVIHYTHRRISFEGRFVKEIIAGGTPSISRQGLASVSTIALNSVAGNYGDAAIAAMSIVTRISMFIFSVIVGLGQGFQPMCGFCYGAKLYDRVKEGFWFGTKIGTLFLLFWSVVLIIFSGEVVSLFRDDPEVIAIGIPALRYQMIIFPACSFMMMANMMMQTCRKTIRANILAASRQGLFFIPLIFVLPYFYGLFGVEICQAVSDVISLIVTIPIVWSAFKEMR
ncbi:MATE family efflux transporter [Prevotella melaninogenica]|uniref:MATE family efflux transporter n=1 Tax=Prevotella melaninogenica TaxID=28132 RepID=UPI0001AE9DA3|nr:MATE family efflux transporter [Prevotella melaninogenica]ADK96931.1 MATE efflux family protein [Prevotella melaninogenica ATCC 25845]ASE18250.1 MATE family efflux transporter [Prevotella melaninogenica]MBW4896757.1 MATE family efflux transporter [Prevotella melaninogenica]UEB09241.1 MATE family efflux transporter [Prevotella melaninogenica]